MSHWNYLKMLVAPKPASYGRTEGEAGTWECRYQSGEGRPADVTVDAWDEAGALKSLAQEGIHVCLECWRYCEPAATELEQSGPSHYCGICVLEKPRRFLAAPNPVNWSSRSVFDAVHNIVAREDRLAAILS